MLCVEVAGWSRPNTINVRLRQRNNSRSLREAVDGTIASKIRTWTYIQLLVTLCRRLDLLHLNVRKLGTISNTVAAATLSLRNFCTRCALVTIKYRVVYDQVFGSPSLPGQ